MVRYKVKIYIMATGHVTIIKRYSEDQLQDIYRHVNVDQHYETKLFKSATNYSSFREVYELVVNQFCD